MTHGLHGPVLEDASARCLVGGVEDRRGEDSADARGVRAAEETTATRPGGRPSRRSPLSQTNSGRTEGDEEGAAYQKERAPPTCSLEPQSQNHPTSQSHANLPPKPSAPDKPSAQTALAVQTVWFCGWFGNRQENDRSRKGCERRSVITLICVFWGKILIRPGPGMCFNM